MCSHFSLASIIDFPKILAEEESVNITIPEKQASSSASVSQLIRNVVEMLILPEVKPMNTDYYSYFDFLLNFAFLGQRDAYILTTYNIITKIDLFYLKLFKNHNQSLMLEDGKWFSILRSLY